MQRRLLLRGRLATPIAHVILRSILLYSPSRCFRFPFRALSVSFRLRRINPLPKMSSFRLDDSTRPAVPSPEMRYYGFVFPAVVPQPVLLLRAPLL